METLLDRSAESDVAEAEAAIERLAAAPADEGHVPMTQDVYMTRGRVHAQVAELLDRTVAARDSTDDMSGE